MRGILLLALVILPLASAQKITDLTELAVAPATGDLLPIVDIDAGPAQTKKIEFGTLTSGIHATILAGSGVTVTPAGGNVTIAQVDVATLTELAVAPADDDVFSILDVDAGPAETKKIQFDTLTAAIHASILAGAGVTVTPAGGNLTISALLTPTGDNTLSGTNDLSNGNLILPQGSGAPSAGACTVSTVGSEYVDSDEAGFRSLCMQTGSGVYTWQSYVAGAHTSDHGVLGGLTDDDHTNYALLAGRAGAQTLIGGTASGENLTLESTANATKGEVISLDTFSVDDGGALRLYEADGNGSNYLEHIGGATRATDIQISWANITGPCVGSNGGVLTLNGSAPNLTIDCEDDDGGAGGFVSFDLAADSGTPETVTDGETVSVLGTAPISIVVSPSQTVTVSLDAAGVTAAHLATDSVNADELNALGVEAELEAVLDLQDVQGAVTDGQVPNNITIDLAALATTATTANNLAADGLDAMTEIAAALKSRADDVDTKIATTSAAAPAGNRCVEMDINGSLVLGADTCANLGPAGSVNSFETINAPLGSDPVADSETDTLNLTTGLGFGIIGTFGTDTLDFLFDYSLTIAGNPALAVEEVIFTADGAAGGGFISEGSVADDFEGLFLLPDVTGADSTQTLLTNLSSAGGDASGTLAALVVQDVQTATANTEAADNSTTQVANTAFVQQEINGAGGTGLSCASGTCNVDLGTSIDDTELTNEDFGDLSCDGTEDGCSLDTNSVGQNELIIGYRSYPRSINLPDPVTGDSGDYQLEWFEAVTLREVSCNTNVASSTVTINLYERSRATPETGTTELLTADLVCDDDGQSTTSFADASIAASAIVALGIDAVSGSPTLVRVHINAAK